MSGRDKFLTRTITLVSDVQRQTLANLAANLPIYSDKPLEVVIREQVKKRGLDANARYWAGPLRDIAEQAWLNGRQYNATIWHEYFKEQFLPEDDDLESLAEAGLVKEGYRKRDFTPDGTPVLVGSTTDLTVRGFALYVQQIEAFGANLGVEFTASPNELRGMQ